MLRELSKNSDKIYFFVHKQNSFPRISLIYFLYNEDKSISFTWQEKNNSILQNKSLPIRNILENHVFTKLHDHSVQFIPPFVLNILSLAIKYPYILHKY